MTIASKRRPWGESPGPVPAELAQRAVGGGVWGACGGICGCRSRAHLRELPPWGLHVRPAAWGSGSGRAGRLSMDMWPGALGPGSLALRLDLGVLPGLLLAVPRGCPAAPRGPCGVRGTGETPWSWGRGRPRSGTETHRGPGESPRANPEAARGFGTGPLSSPLLALCGGQVCPIPASPWPLLALLWAVSGLLTPAPDGSSLRASSSLPEVLSCGLSFEHLSWGATDRRPRGALDESWLPPAWREVGTTWGQLGAAQSAGLPPPWWSCRPPWAGGLVHGLRLRAAHVGRAGGHGLSCVTWGRASGRGLPWSHVSLAPPGRTGWWAG